MNISAAFKNDRLMKSLTGMSKKEFDILLVVFCQVLYENAANKPRQRRVGGGRIGALEGGHSKLFFILFYLKVYPTIDLGSFIFGIDRSRISRQIKKLLPLLEKALGRTVQLPLRRVSSLQELESKFPEVKDFFIDATERPTKRPKSGKIRNKNYSGKRKTHTRKNTIICDSNKLILLVSTAKGGKMHDLKQLKSTDFTEHIDAKSTIWVDKGYQSIAK